MKNLDLNFLLLLAKKRYPEADYWIVNIANSASYLKYKCLICDYLIEPLHDPQYIININLHGLQHIKEHSLKLFI